MSGARYRGLRQRLNSGPSPRFIKTRAASCVRVYIIPAALKVLPQEPRQLYWESQGKKGFFRFVHIPPGEYLVLVNPEDSQTADFSYRRTFHPGVHDRSAATVINVRAGEQIKDADIWLQQQFATQ